MSFPYDPFQLLMSQQELLLNIVDRLAQIEKKLQMEPRIVRQYIRGGGQKTTSFTDLLDMIANAQTPNTLLLDGTRPLTGDLDCGGNRILNIGGTSAQRISLVESASYTDTLDIMNGPASVLKNIRCATFRSSEWRCTSNAALLATNMASSAYVNMQGYSGGWINIMRFGHDGIDPCVSTIYRAGDITFLAGKQLKVGNISGTGTPNTQTKYFPVDDGGVTRYIPLYNALS